GGGPFFVRAWHSVVNRSPNMFTLIALGVGTAFGYSVAATVAPQAFPAGFTTAHGMVEPYFETAAAITVLVLLGQVLELRARRGPRPTRARSTAPAACSSKPSASARGRCWPRSCGW